jgi:hypothetical protein
MSVNCIGLIKENPKTMPLVLGRYEFELIAALHRIATTQQTQSGMLPDLIGLVKNFVGAASMGKHPGKHKSRREHKSEY